MDWFLDNAISRYIIFFAGLILGFLLDMLRDYLQRNRPSIIKIEKSKVASLLSISSEAKKRLQIIYNQTEESRRIDEFWQTTLKFQNIGEKPIADINIQHLLEGELDKYVLEISIDDPYEDRESSYDISYTEKGVPYLKFETSYLNPSKDYMDTINMNVYSSRPLIIKEVKGGGLGWATTYFDRVEYNQKLENVLSEAENSLESMIIRAMFKFIN